MANPRFNLESEPRVVAGFEKEFFWPAVGDLQPHGHAVKYLRRRWVRNWKWGCRWGEEGIRPACDRLTKEHISSLILRALKIIHMYPATQEWQTHIQWLVFNARAHTIREIGRQIGRLAGKKSGRQIDRHASKQTNKYRDKQTDIFSPSNFSIFVLAIQQTKLLWLY